MVFSPSDYTSKELYMPLSSPLFFKDGERGFCFVLLCFKMQHLNS